MSSTPVLPEEIIEEIISHVEDYQDLLSFAAASTFFAQLAVPRHTEYRVIVLAEPVQWIWKHLIRLPSLTRNIRAVHIGVKPTVYPTTLMDNDLDGDPANKTIDKDQLAQDICSALELMDNLQVFTWQWALERMVNPEHRDAIMNVLSRKKSLIHFLSIWNAIDMSLVPVDHSKDQLWNISSLTSITVVGIAFRDYDKAPHILRWLQGSPDLQYLRIGLTVLCNLEDHGQLYFPTLRTLALVGGFDLRAKSFIDRHSTIEELQWNTTQRPLVFSPGSLPNLKRLLCSHRVLEALESAYQESFLVSITENDSSLQLPPPSSDMLERGGKYGIEAVVFENQFHIPHNNLLDFGLFDPLSLKMLWLAGLETIETLSTLANKFPEIKSLYIPIPVGDPGDPRRHSLGEWLNFVSRFPKLEAIGGADLFRAAKEQSLNFEEAVAHLVASCPYLKFLNDCDLNDGPSHRYVIRRHEGVQYPSQIQPEPNQMPKDFDLLREERRLSWTQYLEPLNGRFNNVDYNYIPSPVWSNL